MQLRNIFEIEYKYISIYQHDIELCILRKWWFEKLIKLCQAIIFFSSVIFAKEIEYVPSTFFSIIILTFQSQEDFPGIVRIRKISI